MITIQREAILDAFTKARTHLHYADHAASTCLHADHKAQGTTKPWLQALLTNESKEAAQLVTTEQDKAIDAVTQLIIKATGQNVTITDGQE